MSQSETGIPQKPEKVKYMSKFKVGDKVKVIKSNHVKNEDVGHVGTVFKICNGVCLIDFGKRTSFTLFGDGCTMRYYRENEIEFAETERNWKIVIIPDGDKTTALYYENGKVVKTEEVKRYFKDEYSVEDTVEAVTKKLFNKADTFNWEDFKNTKFGVRFHKESDYHKFLKACDEHGIKWNHGGKATSGDISYKDCIVLHCGMWSSDALTWCIRTNATEYDGKPIIEYHNTNCLCTIKKEAEPKFKPGDLVEVVETCDSCPVGLRGHIVCKSESDWWLVDFHVNYRFTHHAYGSKKPLPEETGYYILEKCLKKVN